jgi:hypothetical protein
MQHLPKVVEKVMTIQNMSTDWVSAQLARGQMSTPIPRSTLPDELSGLEQVQVQVTQPTSAPELGVSTSHKRKADALDSESDKRSGTQPDAESYAESYAESGAGSDTDTESDAESDGMERVPSCEAYADYPETPKRGSSAERYVRMGLELFLPQN